MVGIMKKKRNEFEEPMVQKAIDPITGRDITGEVISTRLGELEVLADKIIEKAVKDCEINPHMKETIYKEGYWEIHERLGTGSIGPATAAAGPLMSQKKEELRRALDISKEERDQLLG
jgi:hypothetical protein